MNTKLCLGLIPAALIIVSCETMNSPIASSSFDPLSPPGSGVQMASASNFGPTLAPGTFVTASIENTAFYKQKPKGDADADKLLKRGTQMKIVSTDNTHARVELDSGEVGFVPSVMVQQAADTTPAPIVGDGMYQVFPPIPEVGTIEPLPIMDPGGIPPEGAIPAIIDPDAPIPTTPISIDPIPDLTPTEPAPADATKKTEVEAAIEVDAAGEMKKTEEKEEAATE